jgi:hypothetical protein
MTDLTGETAGPPNTADAINEYSALWWEEELSRIANGERELTLIRLGSAQEYVENRILTSGDRPRSATAFRQALRNFVTSWNPLSTEAPDSLSHILDLIGAFTPSIGFTKILGHIIKWGAFGPSAAISPVTDRCIDLHQKALNVLEEYFKAPPQDALTDPAFRAYTQVLRDHLGDRNYGPYAARRLLELGIISPDDSVVYNIIERDPNSLVELLGYYLKLGNVPNAEYGLSYLYSHCLTMPHGLDGFDQALETYGATIRYNATYPTIAAPDRELEVSIQESLLDTYLTLRLKRGSATVAARVTTLELAARASNNTR